MRKFIFILIFLFFTEISCLAQGEEYPVRLVSLAPSITEILYELGLGEKVVGVTNYCSFPEDAKAKAKIGGYLDTNYEAIILLRPDLVIMSDDYGEEIKKALDGAGIEYMTVSTVDIAGILDSIRVIGQKCGAEKKAEEVIARIRGDIKKWREAAKGKPAERVMIVVGRNAGALEEIYVAGRNSYYDELLRIIGCENVCERRDIDYPGVSIEGILRMDPDIIVEVLANLPDEKKADIINEWSPLKDINAVKNNRVYILNCDYVSIPGPRFTLLLKDLEKISEDSDRSQ